MNVLEGRKYATARDGVLVGAARLRWDRRIGGDIDAPTGVFELLHMTDADFPPGEEFAGVPRDELIGSFVITETADATFVGTFDKPSHADDEFEQLERKFRKWLDDNSECERCEIGSGRHGGDCELLKEAKARHRAVDDEDDEPVAVCTHGDDFDICSC